LIGIIYLENNLSEGAFTADRIEVLNVLSAQICISIDNAHLYESLDEKVRLRTAELNKKNIQLNTTLGKLKNTQSKLVSSEKMASLGQLTAGIAHEINNPVNFISGNIGPLTRDIEDIKELLLLVKSLENPENLREKLTKIRDFREEIEADYLFEEIELLLNGIKDGATRTKEIVLGLKNFSRLDEQDFKMADVHEGIDSTFTLLNNKLKNRIEVFRNYDPNLPRIECLPGKLNQVFMNILNNAMDAIEDTGEIHITTRQLDNKLEIRIRDTGSGMPKEVAEHIFEPFYTTKDVGAGTGLGLSITYGIIQQHKGDIRVESTPGEGTEFIIEIPMGGERREAG
jgi:signal transduction histidine kinase